MNEQYDQNIEGDIAYLHALNLPAWGPTLTRSSLNPVRGKTMAEIVSCVRRAMCEDIYPDETFGTHERTFHADVPSLSQIELADQRDRLKLRLLIEPRPSRWLQERLAAILLELKQRQRA